MLNDHLWWLHLDDQLNSIDIQATSSNICGHQNVKLPLPEGLQGCLQTQEHSQQAFISMCKLAQSSARGIYR